MYHEVTEPYSFLWHLLGGLKEGGLVVVVDADRPVKQHGMPPELLDCEFSALGLRKIAMAPVEGADSYMALFAVERRRPEPHEIKPCPIKP